MAAYTRTAASVIPSAQAKYLNRAIAGAAIEAGQPYYIDSAGLAQLTDNNGSATTADVQAVCVANAAAGQPVSGVYDDPDFTHGLATVAAGDAVYTHSTAGALGPAADLATGHYTSLVMIATSATKAVLKIVRSGVAHA